MLVRGGDAVAVGPAHVVVVGLVVVLVVAGLAALAVLRRVGIADGATAEACSQAPLLARLCPPADLTDLPSLRPGTAPAAALEPLRTAVERRVGRDGSAVVVLAGIAPDELNAWVGADLAIALAGAGRRTLLVDGRMGDRFGRPAEATPDTPGLSGVLAGTPLPRATSDGPVAGLRVLPAGPGGDRSAEEQIRRAFGDLVRQARGGFDVVVVLGPPLGRCDDALLMVHAAPESVRLVLTLPSGRVSRRSVRRHADRARGAGCPLLGVVLLDQDGPVGAHHAAPAGR